MEYCITRVSTNPKRENIKRHHVYCFGIFINNYTKLPYYIKKEIGKGLKELRNKKKILAEDPGEQIGIKAKNKAEPIYHLENGHGSKKRVEALCGLYGTTLEDILNEYAYEAIRKKIRKQ